MADKNQITPENFDGDDAMKTIDQSQISLVKDNKTAQGQLTNVEFTTQDLLSKEQKCLTWVQGKIKFMGSVAEGLPQGEGELIWHDGKRFKGVWNNGVLTRAISEENNIQARIWADQTLYLGPLENELPHGEKGEMHWTDGHSYNGEFHRGCFHNYGTLKCQPSKKDKKEQKFEGRWTYGLFEDSQLDQSCLKDLDQAAISEIHHQKAIKKEQVANTVISQFNRDEFYQTLPVKACNEQDLLVVAKSVSEEMNVCPLSAKSTQKDLDWLKTHQTPLTICQQHMMQRLPVCHLKSEIEELNCSNCHQLLRNESVITAYSCESPGCATPLICSHCATESAHKVQIMSKTSEHHYYKQYKLGESSNSLYRMVESDDDNFSVPTIELSFTTREEMERDHWQSRLKLSIQHPVVIDTGKNVASYNTDFYFFEREVVFLDQHRRKVMWFTFQAGTLKLNSLDLQIPVGERIFQSKHLKTDVRLSEHSLLVNALQVQEITVALDCCFLVYLNNIQLLFMGQQAIKRSFQFH